MNFLINFRTCLIVRTLKRCNCFDCLFHFKGSSLNIFHTREVRTGGILKRPPAGGLLDGLWQSHQSSTGGSFFAQTWRARKNRNFPFWRIFINRQPNGSTTQVLQYSIPWLVMNKMSETYRRGVNRIRHLFIAIRQR